MRFRIRWRRLLGVAADTDHYEFDAADWAEALQHVELMERSTP